MKGEPEDRATQEVMRRLRLLDVEQAEALYQKAEAAVRKAEAYAIECMNNLIEAKRKAGIK